MNVTTPNPPTEDVDHSQLHSKDFLSLDKQIINKSTLQITGLRVFLHPEEKEDSSEKHSEPFSKRLNTNLKISESTTCNADNGTDVVNEYIFGNSFSHTYQDIENKLQSGHALQIKLVPINKNEDRLEITLLSEDLEYGIRSNRLYGDFCENIETYSYQPQELYKSQKSEISDRQQTLQGNSEEVMDRLNGNAYLNSKNYSRFFDTRTESSTRFANDKYTKDEFSNAETVDIKSVLAETVPPRFTPVTQTEDTTSQSQTVHLPCSQTKRDMDASKATYLDFELHTRDKISTSYKAAHITDSSLRAQVSREELDEGIETSKKELSTLFLTHTETSRRLKTRRPQPPINISDKDNPAPSLKAKRNKTITLGLKPPNAFEINSFKWNRYPAFPYRIRNRASFRERKTNNQIPRHGYPSGLTFGRVNLESTIPGSVLLNPTSVSRNDNKFPSSKMYEYLKILPSDDQMKEDNIFHSPKVLKVLPSEDDQVKKDSVFHSPKTSEEFKILPSEVDCAECIADTVTKNRVKPLKLSLVSECTSNVIHLTRTVSSRPTINPTCITLVEYQTSGLDTNNTRYSQNVKEIPDTVVENQQIVNQHMKNQRLENQHIEEKNMGNQQTENQSSRLVCEKDTQSTSHNVIFCRKSQTVTVNDGQLIICLCDDCYFKTQKTVEDVLIKERTPPTDEDIKIKDTSHNKSSDFLVIDQKQLKCEPPDLLDVNIPEDSMFIKSQIEDLNPFCQLVNNHLLNLKPVDEDVLKESIRVLNQEWLQVAANKNSKKMEVCNYLQFFREFSDNLIKMLLHSVDRQGNNALHFAYGNNRFDLAEELLNNKYGPELLTKKNELGHSPLMICSISQPETEEDWRIVQKTIELGNVNEVSISSGQAPLMNAASRGSAVMVQLLLDSGANSNQQDQDGSTALMYASEHGHEACVNLLLEHPKCDPFLKDHDGQTALAIALGTGHKDIALIIYLRSTKKTYRAGQTIKEHSKRSITSTRNSDSFYIDSRSTV